MSEFAVTELIIWFILIIGILVSIFFVQKYYRESKETQENNDKLMEELAEKVVEDDYDDGLHWQ